MAFSSVTLKNSRHLIAHCKMPDLQSEKAKNSLEQPGAF